MNPWMKKLFSGEIPISLISKFRSAFRMFGNHRMTVAAIRISRIFERFIFLNSTAVNVKIFMQITS